MIESFHKESYQIHEKAYSTVQIEKELALYKNWFENNSTDIWRHLRMLDFLDIILKHYQGSRWLTVGDGRFGTSAIYLNARGAHAMPTDIDVSLLKVAQENNMIPEFAYANAEALPFDDESFDFSFCKAAFHHFPRAYISIFEMLRVSRNAVMLVEPCDFLPSPIPRRLLQLIKNTGKKILGMKVPHSDTGNYEPIGNYIFSLSPREVQKIAMGMQYSYVAYKKFHDVYIEGVEYEKMDAKAPLFSKIKKAIFIQKLKKLTGLSGYNQIIAIIFKKDPSKELMADLKEQGFTVVHLPTNPYL
jgi:ubiquinone/menaquinone biosynthesis C-methylase UbiE